MRVLVFNGSPKGNLSVTLHSVLFLQNKYNEEQFEIINVGVKIKQFEKDFSSIINSIQQADLILFAYPVYTFLVPYQLHRFFELLKKYCKENSLDLSDKFSTQISTSKHFYDTTAHQFIEDNCQDLNLKVLKGFSADMVDLLNIKGQNQLNSYWEWIQFQVKNQFCLPHRNRLTHEARPKEVNLNTDKTFNESEKLDHKKIVIISDFEDQDHVLKQMIQYFQFRVPYKTNIINLREFPFKSGCLGCFKCASSGVCVIPDQFDLFLNNEILNSDAIINAFSIKDHSMGSFFKLYEDRQFCNGHRTVSMGMPIGYLISGPYSQEFNLQTIIEARAQVGQQILTGIATDEISQNDPQTILRNIDQLSKQLEYALEHKIRIPQNFYGVGGLKIFRDLIYETQGLMKEDYKFYKANGFFDFPHKNWKAIWLMKFLGFIMSNKKLQKKYANQMNHYILKPYQTIIKKQND